MGRNLNPDQKNRLDAALAVAYGDPAAWTVPCSWCLDECDLLDDTTYHRDRVVPGSRYAYDTVLPTCVGCNEDRLDSTEGEWQEANRAYGVQAGIGCPDTATWKRLRDTRRAARGRAAEDRAARRAAVRSGQR